MQSDSSSDDHGAGPPRCRGHGAGARGIVGLARLRAADDVAHARSWARSRDHLHRVEGSTIIDAMLKRCPGRSQASVKPSRTDHR